MNPAISDLLRPSIALWDHTGIHRALLYTYAEPCQLQPIYQHILDKHGIDLPEGEKDVLMGQWNKAFHDRLKELVDRVAAERSSEELAEGRHLPQGTLYRFVLEGKWTQQLQNQLNLFLESAATAAAETTIVLATKMAEYYASREHDQ